MELKEFIETSLSEIVEGVRSAQEKTKGTGAVIAPRKEISTRHGPAGETVVYLGGGSQGILSTVEFDVMVTESESGSAKGGLAVFFGAFGGGASTEEEQQTSNVNRIRVEVPVVLPSGSE